MQMHTTGAGRLPSPAAIPQGGRSMRRLGSAGAIALAIGVAPVALADTVEMTMSLVVPPTHVIAAGQFVPWANDVEKATEGRVKFRLLPKAVSGPGQQLDSIRQGVADVAFIAHG